MASSSTLLTATGAYEMAGKKPRERARDKGTVTPIGVEVLTSIHDDAEKLRKKKRWTKRTIWEEAMLAFISEHWQAVDKD